MSRENFNRIVYNYDQIFNAFADMPKMAIFSHAVDSIHELIQEISVQTGDLRDWVSFYKIIYFIKERSENLINLNLNGQVDDLLKSGKSSDEIFDWLSQLAWTLIR